MDEVEQPDDAASSENRRGFIMKAAIATGAVWVAPIVLSSPAFAQGSGAGTPVTVPIGGPPTPAPCGQIIVLAAGANTYDLYQTQGNTNGMRAFAITAIGANVIALSTTLPVNFPGPPGTQPIVITTDGPATGFIVNMSCFP